MRIGYFKKTLFYWDELAETWLEMKIDKKENRNGLTLQTQSLYSR